MLQTDVLAQLRTYQPQDETERAFHAQMLDFVARRRDFASRTNPLGHFTASGWVINVAGSHALLLHHAKLDRWLQPGGHIEDHDRSLADAAQREVQEETGLERPTLVTDDLFDIDVHTIPARGTEGAHLHYDCRFLFRSDASAIIQASAESHGFEWVCLHELATPTTLPSLRRMATKALEYA